MTARTALKNELLELTRAFGRGEFTSKTDAVRFGRMHFLTKLL